MNKLDILFINPNSSKEVYQDLSNDFSAKEPPTWLLLLSEGCRTKGYSVEVIDCDAERLQHVQTIERIQYFNPKLICFVVYGQNPSAGIANMSGAVPLAKSIKENTDTPIIFIGTYASALPHQILEYKCIDFVSINEGLYCLLDLLQTNLQDDLDKVRALGYKKDDQIIINSGNNSLVPQERMDVDLPGYAWDLLPYNNKPLDLYRTPNWHSHFNPNHRTPFMSIYTSLGCQFKCPFCVINLINRTNNSKGSYSGQFNKVRYWSTNKVSQWFKELTNLTISNISIKDELFFFNKKHYTPILKDIINKEYNFNMWAYTRIDTLKESFLGLCKDSGINWLAPGIETAGVKLRKDNQKGGASDEEVIQKIKLTQQYDINIIGDYMFGLPNDTIDTMQDTLDFMLELNTETLNCYACMALPGTKLYYDAIEQKMEMPNTFSGYGFLAYDCIPMRTEYCTKEEVLKFRDNAWYTYFTHPPYLALVKRKFGQSALDDIKQMTSIKLKRKILGD